MMSTKNWLDQCQQLANQPPLRKRLPLLCKGVVFGSLDSEVLTHLVSLLGRGNAAAVIRVSGSGSTATVDLVGDDASQALAQLALVLRSAGIAGAWRDELLAVADASGHVLGAVERGVARVLGIATVAVHLVGWADAQTMWVQKRSATKANDPGLWDTLMGGMVTARDSIESAMVRETWEEAGLQLDALPAPSYGGPIHQRRPSDDGMGGYLIETAHWYEVNLPIGCVPRNQDGEVDEFACLTREQVLAGLAARTYTLEAGLILGACLNRNPSPGLDLV